MKFQKNNNDEPDNEKKVTKVKTDDYYQETNKNNNQEINDKPKTESNTVTNDNWNCNKRLLMDVQFRKNKLIASAEHEQKQ